MKSINIHDFIFELVAGIAEYNNENDKKFDTSDGGSLYYRNRIPYEIYHVIEKAQKKTWEKTHAS